MIIRGTKPAKSPVRPASRARTARRVTIGPLPPAGASGDERLILESKVSAGCESTAAAIPFALISEVEQGDCTHGNDSATEGHARLLQSAERLLIDSLVHLLMHRLVDRELLSPRQRRSSSPLGLLHKHKGSA